MLSRSGPARQPAAAAPATPIGVGMARSWAARRGVRGRVEDVATGCTCPHVFDRADSPASTSQMKQGYSRDLWLGSGSVTTNTRLGALPTAMRATVFLVAVSITATESPMRSLM
jgi:hypothetical protein